MSILTDAKQTKYTNHVNQAIKKFHNSKLKQTEMCKVATIKKTTSVKRYIASTTNHAQLPKQQLLII